LPPGPSHIRRLGHVVLGVSDLRRSEAWYKERFGFLTSDAIEKEPGTTIGKFLRADRGDQPTDHHSLFLLETGSPSFRHSAFEVADLDDLVVGHAHLRQAGYRHDRGIGRHIFGSQVYDYWNDPYGHEIEHWTDGDQLAASDPPGVGTLQELRASQWILNPPAPKTA
jgi:catechol 2,3-dioxygenase-like lactoylglutathione lyase family enzyme